MLRADSPRAALSRSLACPLFALTVGLLGLTASRAPARAQETWGDSTGGAEQATEIPADAVKVVIAAVAVEPGLGEMGERGRPVRLITAEVTDRGREVHHGRSFGEGLKDTHREGADEEAKIKSVAMAKEELYGEWLRSMAGIHVETVPLATLRLTQFDSKLELACEKDVTPGEPIQLYMQSVGGADTDWRVCVVRPESSMAKWGLGPTYTGSLKFDQREFRAGKRILGEPKSRVKVFSFDTSPADRGKLIGILVEQRDYSAFQHIFWVKAADTPPRPRPARPELPADHPLADPLVRGLLGDLADVTEDNWRQEQWRSSLP